jgi:hypothetical protein
VRGSCLLKQGVQLCSMRKAGVAPLHVLPATVQHRRQATVAVAEREGLPVTPQETGSQSIYLRHTAPPVKVSSPHNSHIYDRLASYSNRRILSCALASALTRIAVRE